MDRRTGSLNVNFHEIARELGVSAMTVYRVVNLDPAVKRETRERVTDALNRCGFFTHRRGKRFKVLFDFIDHPYLSHYGEKLLTNIQKLGFHCCRTSHRTARTDFLDTAAVSDVAVFLSVPDNAIIDEARRVNPDLYTVTLSTRSNADVTLSPDNTRGGELAARHLFRHRHRHIAIHLAERHPTRLERCKAFCGEITAERLAAIVEMSTPNVSISFPMFTFSKAPSFLPAFLIILRICFWFSSLSSADTSSRKYSTRIIRSLEFNCRSINPPFSSI